MDIIFNNKNKSYKSEDRIGKGYSGNIYKVLEIGTNKYYALKFFPVVKNEERENFKEFEKDIEVMKHIKNKYIIELIDYFFDEKQKGYCIVMELCDGNLRDILDNNPNGLPIIIIKKIFTQLNEALKLMQMQKEKYYHRDLKPENILIKYTDNNKTDFDIILTDFGLSSNEINSIVEYHTKVGSERYKAPEVDDFEYNNKIDLWSLGIILYELYTNKYIFDSKNLKERNDNRKKGRIVEETDNEMINKLIRKLIQVDIKQRIGWKEYFNDDFFKIKAESELNSNLLVK